MPDESWKGVRDLHLDILKVATSNTKPGRRVRTSRSTRSRWTGGTGKYEGAKGGGTYTYDNLTDTLSAGRYKGKMELP